MINAIRTPFKALTFITAVVILLFSAIGLRSCIDGLSRKFQKERISLRRSLHDFDVEALPITASGWRYKKHTSTDEIGTEEYALVSFDKNTTGPGHVELFITYYSDPDSKVAHTPEVCGRQAGDIVAGDQDGVVIIPQEQAIDVANALPKVFAKEQHMEAEVQAGKITLDWLEEIYSKKGVDYLD